MRIAEIQEKLNSLGYGPLIVDGQMGPNTLNAIRRFQKDKGLTVDGKVGPKTEEALFGCVKGKLMSTTEIMAKYGSPGPSNLTNIVLPFDFIVAWDKSTKIRSFQCHKKIADSLKAVFNQILSDYGEAEINRLGINLYGGCYNYRKMRGGSDWSRHAWGIAIDLDPERNPLKGTHRTATFAKPEYKKMIDAFYKYGFVGLGPEQDRDWMHFQIGS